MSRNVIETILGALVLLVGIGFAVWAYERSNVSEGTGGYELLAKFDRADGLDVGADVRISGIKVGKVTSETLDTKSYRAEVRFTVRNGIELPADSSASIASASLLGGKFLSLSPGGDDEMLKSGQEITLTQSSINIEDLVGKFIYGQGSGAAKPGAAPPPAAGGGDDLLGGQGDQPAPPAAQPAPQGGQASPQ